MARRRVLPALALLVLWTLSSQAEPNLDFGAPRAPEHAEELGRGAKGVPVPSLVEYRDSELPVNPDLRKILQELRAATPAKPLLREWHTFQRRRFPFDWEPEAQWRERGLQFIQTRMSVPRDAEGARWVEMKNPTLPGRVNAMAIHPANPSVLYAGTGGGGVWKSTDGGSNWVPLTDNQCALMISSLALDPQNPEVIYAGTGEGFDWKNMNGCGLLRSSDGGRSWSSLPVKVNRITGIWLPPGQAGAIVLGTDQGALVSSDGGASFAASAGLPPQRPEIMQIAVQPARAQRIFAALKFHGIFRSEDGGRTWAAAPGLPGTDQVFGAGVGVDPSNPDRVLASLGRMNAETTEKGRGSLLGLYLSEDGGNSWRQLPAAPNFTGSQAWYCNNVAFDAGSPQTFYVAGLDVYRSTDGGQSFEQLTDWRLMYKEGYNQNPKYVHADQHQIVTPRPGEVWIGSDGGISVSTDSGKSWKQRGVGLGVQMYYSIVTDPQAPGLILGGAQDNGTHATEDGGKNWFMPGGGDGGFTARGENPKSYYLSSQMLYIERIRPGVERKELASPWEQESRGFIAPYIVHPADEKSLLAGSVRVWLSPDGGDTWNPISSPFAEAGEVTAIAASKTAPGTIVVGFLGYVRNTTFRRLFATSDGGKTWAQVDEGLPQRYPTSVAIHPEQPNVVLAGFSGLGTSHVFRSADGGKTWADIGQGLPDVGVNVVRFNPYRPQEIWIGTDLGVHRSKNDGGAWEKAPSGLPHAPVYDLQFRPDGRLLAGTFGRGMWELQPAGTAAGGSDVAAGGDLNKYFTPGGAPQAGQGAGGGLQLDVQMSKGGGAPTYRVGEPFGVQLSCSQACFVALGHISSAGQFDLLMPPVKLAAGQKLPFPAAGLTVKVQPPAGQETLIAVASTEALPGHQLSSADALRALRAPAVRQEITYTIAE